MKTKIQSFLDAVCCQINYREVHSEICLELGGHLEAVVERYVGQGLSETDAVDRALADMGDPVLIGQQLNQAHKPRIEWGLMAATTLLLMLGAWAMYAVGVSGSSAFEVNLLSTKLVWSAVGLALGFALFFLDYRRLGRYSSLLYVVTLVGTVFLALTGPWVNGQPRGIGHTPIFFAVALAGIFSTWDWDRPWALIKAVGLFAAPMLVYLKFAGLMVEGLQFAAAFGVLVLRSRPHRWQAAGLVGLGLLAVNAVALYVWNTPHLSMRFHTMFFPFDDPQGVGYLAIQSRLAIENAGLWGQGVTANLNQLPETHSDFIFSYLVYTLGWLAGAAICLVIVFFLGRMLLASQRVKGLYGSNLITTVATLFAFRFVWNVLMTVGLLPTAGVDLPFVSHGMQAALQLGLVGLVLGVFRRKDMVRSSLLLQ